MNIKDEIRKINEQATQIRLITNEIIDHLPQEKEPKYCPICKWCVLPETIFCPNCKEDLRRQPTKEVPDVRQELIDAIRLILPLAKGYAYTHDIESNVKFINIAIETIAKAEQEISALYRKEK